MKRELFDGFKKQLSNLSSDELIDFALKIRALSLGFKRYGKMMCTNEVIQKLLQDKELGNIVQLLQKMWAWDRQSLQKIERWLQDLIGETERYAQVVANTKIVDEVNKLLQNDWMIVDSWDSEQLQLKVSTSQRIYYRSLEWDLNKLLS